MNRNHRLLMTSLVVVTLGHSIGSVRAEMVAYWKFDDANGTAVVDSAGGHNGRLAGNPVWVGGYFGGALKFDGVDDYVNCGGGKRAGDPNTWADINGPITIAAWIKVQAFTKTYQAILTKGDGAWRISRDSTTDSVLFAGNIGDAIWRIRGSTKVNDGQWHHVAGIYDGSTASLYVDGKPDGSLPNAPRIMSNNFDVCIGTNMQAARRQWAGLIDEVVVFSHAMSQDELKQLYELGSESFLSEGLRKLGALVQDGQKALDEKGAKEAVAIIEKKIADAKRWKDENPGDIRDPHRMAFSRLSFMLAKAKEASGAQRAEVSKAYSESAMLSTRTPHYVGALLWLFRSMSADDYAGVVRQSIRNSPGVSSTVGHAVADFEVEGDWAAFKLFLDAAIPEIGDATACAETVAASLKKDGLWAKSFAQYCRNKPELSCYVIAEDEKLAEEATKKTEFLKAAEIYRNILTRCDTGQKIGYELKLCECLFLSGQCDKAIPEIDSFIEKHRVKDRAMVIQAVLLKGRTYLQMNETERASNIFLELLVDYPETKKSPEANFFIGYCSMLQGNFEEAKEALQFVIKDYPDSPYASKARLCMRRIDKMAD